MDTTTTRATAGVASAGDHDTSGAGQKVLLTVEAAAARLSISRTRMYGLLKTGDVTGVHIGRLRRIHTAELDAFATRLRGTQPTA